MTTNPKNRLALLASFSILAERKRFANFELPCNSQSRGIPPEFPGLLFYLAVKKRKEGVNCEFSPLLKKKRRFIMILRMLFSLLARPEKEKRGFIVILYLRIAVQFSIQRNSFGTPQTFFCHKTKKRKEEVYRDFSICV